MEFEFTLNKNDQEIVASYGVLAIHNLLESANKDFKLKDIRLIDLKKEILDTCVTRTITAALDLSMQFIQEEAQQKNSKINCVNKN